MPAHRIEQDLANLDQAGETLTIPCDVAISGAVTQSGVVTFTGTPKVDTIAENTSAAGVTIDSCLIKDGRAAALATAAMVLSAEVTGTGSSQDTAHGLGAAPSLCFAVVTETDGNASDIAHGTHDATNAKFTVTSGHKYRVVAFK